MTRVARSFEESPLAQHSSRSVLDVAHSPAMGIVDASVSGNAITAFSRTHDGDAYPSENGPGVLHPGSVTSTHVVRKLGQAYEVKSLPCGFPFYVCCILESCLA